MPQPDRPSVCPRCHEPLEDGDLHRGACGAGPTAGTGGSRPSIPPPPAAPPVPPVPPAPPSAPPAAPDAVRDGSDYLLPPPAPAPPVPQVPPPPAVPPSAPAPPAAPAAQAGGEAQAEDAGRSGGAGQAGPPAPDPRESPLPAGAQGGAPAGGAPAGGGQERCVACGTGAVDAEGRCEHCGHAQPRERDHMEEESEGVAAVSDRGLRHHRNEDSFAVSAVSLPDGSPAVIAVVCDGVSSATRPDEASAAAADSACASMRRSLPRGADPRQAMHDALVAASEAVNALAPEPRDPVENAPACTIVGAVVAGDLLTVGWIGDSRAYWIPEDRSTAPARLTEDDSWAAQMVAAGLMEEAEAYADARAHAITGWLGADAYEIDPHTASFTPDRPGVVVVCTDGLWNYAESAEEMAGAVPADARTHPMRSARHLVGHALDGGGHDNVTVAVLPFPAPPGAGRAVTG
ncbi:PP2C family protein-serine/threonine phosphatase [Streptomyces fenghuangensis]